MKEKKEEAYFVFPQPTWDSSAEAIVLGAGDFPCHPLAVKMLEQAPYLVCCDGAANTLLDSGRQPDAIVGDGDSLLPQYKERFADIVHSDSDQETNDQTKAIEFLVCKGFRRILILGATGRREDHTLGNICLLAEYQKRRVEVQMLTDNGLFLFCRGDASFRCYPEQAFSVFNISAQNLLGKGLAFPLYKFTSWWQGTLNKATDKVVEIKSDGDYLVFLAHG